MVRWSVIEKNNVKNEIRLHLQTKKEINKLQHSMQTAGQPKAEEL